MASAYAKSYNQATCTFNSGGYDDTENPPIVAIVFDCTFEFLLEGDTPTEGDVFDTASNFNENDYLESFVKLAEPPELFAL